MLNRDFKEFAELPNARHVDVLTAADFATETVINKRSVGRLKDLADLESLEHSAGPDDPSG